MTAAEFAKWLADLKSAGIATTDKDAAELLGLDKVRIAQMKSAGTQKLQTDLACAAILAGLPPYSSEG